MVDIEIDDCHIAFECQKCVQACPLNVIALDPEILENFEDVKKWKIIAIFKDLCNGCQRCVAACPESRIRIIIHTEIDHERGHELIEEDPEFQDFLKRKTKTE